MPVLTTEQYDELKLRMLHFRDLAGAFVPPYAMPDLLAAWADVNEILGAISEDATRDQYADGQLDMFAGMTVEGWPC